MNGAKRAMIINCCYTSNFGDQAIGKTMQNLLSAQKYQVDLMDLINVDVERRSEEYYNDACRKELPLNFRAVVAKQKVRTRFDRELNLQKWKIKHISKIREICKRKHDLVIIGGGELIQSNGIFPMAIHTWIKSVKRYNPKARIIFFGIGVTAKYERIDRKRLSKAIEYAEAVFVRDQESAVNVSAVFGKTAQCIPDVVWGGYNIQYQQPEICNTILYGITSFSRLKRYQYKNFETRLDYYEDCYQEMVNKGWALQSGLKLMYSDTQDYNECHTFAKYIKENYGASIAVCCYKTLDAFEKEISQAKLVISPRMHACIFGLLYGCEVLPVCISPKLQSFVEECKSAQHNGKESALRERILCAVKSITGNKE